MLGVGAWWCPMTDLGRGPEGLTMVDSCEGEPNEGPAMVDP
jgi:hypothetical protein